MNFIRREPIAFFILLIVHVHTQAFDGGVEYYDDPLDVNETLLLKPVTNIKASASSRIISTLITPSNRSSPTRPLTTRPTTTVIRTTATTTTTVAPMPPAILANTLLRQFNHYRNVDILSRIRQCDPKMKLTEMCEAYTVNNHTYAIVREPNIEFAGLNQVYSALIDRGVVKKLISHCTVGRWCLGNISQQDIRFTIDVLRQHGRAFCALDQCYDRLTIHANTCPAIVSRNVSAPTLKLLPMLCALYKEPQGWNSFECARQILYLLHVTYAFWPHLETCHRQISAGVGGCTANCLAFDDLLHRVAGQCNPNASFLDRVPTLAWYRLINLKQTCRHQSIATRSPFISSVKDFIASNMVWYRLHQRPVYAALFIIVVICIVISFSLCLYAMSRYDYEPSSRRLDDDYEYTRLHESTFELGANTEIPNASGFDGDIANSSSFDTRRHHRSPEHQRLL